MTFDERFQSKGTENVISLLQYYLEVIHPRTVNRCTHLVVFTDSWGENKKQIVIAYFRWRVQMGWYSKICSCFLEGGRTRFSLDTNGGLFRMHEIKCGHETHLQLLNVINNSTPFTGRSIGLLVPDNAFYDWSALHALFYALHSISRAHMIELVCSDAHRVVTRWRETYNCPLNSVRLVRLGGLHWSFLKVKTDNRKWIQNEHGFFLKIGQVMRQWCRHHRHPVSNHRERCT